MCDEKKQKIKNKSNLNKWKEERIHQKEKKKKKRVADNLVGS